MGLHQLAAVDERRVCHGHLDRGHEDRTLTDPDRDRLTAIPLLAAGLAAPCVVGHQTRALTAQLDPGGLSEAEGPGPRCEPVDTRVARQVVEERVAGDLNRLLDRDAAMPPLLPAVVRVAIDRDPPRAEDAVRRSADAVAQGAGGEQRLDGGAGRVEGLQGPVVQGVERVADQLVPLRRFQVTGEEIGVERRLREEDPHRAVARVEGEHGADLSRHRLGRFALEGKVECDLQRPSSDGGLLVERRDLLAESVHHHDQVSGRAAQHVLVGALDAGPAHELAGAEAGVVGELLGRDLAELAHEVSDGGAGRE